MKLVIPDTPDLRLVQPVPMTDFFAWARELVGGGGGEEIAEETTASGWPLFVITVRGAAGSRVVGLYRFFDRVAAAIAEDVPDGRLGALSAALRAARLADDGEPVDLADLLR